MYLIMRDIRTVILSIKTVYVILLLTVLSQNIFLLILIIFNLHYYVKF